MRDLRNFTGFNGVRTFTGTVYICRAAAVNSLGPLNGTALAHTFVGFTDAGE